MELRKFLGELLARAAHTVGGSGVLEAANGRDGLALAIGAAVQEHAVWQPRWTLEKYRGGVRPENLYAAETVAGNKLLNEGITTLWQLLIGGTATPYSNANARIGVGNGTTAAAATQTDLVGTSKAYKGMDAGYPQVSNQYVIFRSTFGPTEANFDWREMVVDNGATDGMTLNRKVENHGTKANTDTWVLTLTVTLA